MLEPIQKNTHLSLIEGEDLVLFINACFTCTGQNEFYEEAYEQGLSIDFLHQYILGNYRRLYALTLATGINHYNQALIIFNLLSSGAPSFAANKLEESNLIWLSLQSLPANRVFKLFATLKKQKVNNRRTRAVIKRYLASRKDPAFDAVKYRTKVKQAIMHAHLKVCDERGRFLFEKESRKPFETPIFDSFQRAKYSKQAIYELPYTVAEGLAQKQGIPRNVFLKSIESNLTKNEKLRLQKSAQRQKKVSLDVDFKTVDVTRLSLYWLSLPYETRKVLKDKFESALDYHAQKLIAGTQLARDKVAVVIDRSFSMWGSQEKQRRPLAVGFAIHQVLKRVVKDYSVFWSTPVKDDLFVQPKGQSNIAEPFVNALKQEPDVLIIVSDGFENDPTGLTSQIYQSWLKIKSRTRNTNIIHINPVYDANRFDVKKLSEGITSVGIRNVEDIAVTMEYSRFANGRATIEMLEDYVYRKYREQISAA
ncbi:hypothetical protein [Pleionea sp. CnH1-48]|uniref:hypothetical protein n=1 Tax=Pleionea sp. CnH1-48 TaxID=2954494 RepID=UPI00209740C9|nr:hypothetical protein [Pleionea sp. CnH1-48]MCO7223285.1 hypothetical protein [Pleionea sp. CnH1-48]